MLPLRYFSCRPQFFKIHCLKFYFGLQVELTGQKVLLASHPDIIIATPATVLSHLSSNRIFLKDSLQFLVIDEADLVFSFGFEADLKSVLQ